MRSYLSLIPIAAKVHRRQNRMTFLCIVFAVFMITAVFSLAEMGVRMEGTRLIEKHGVEALKSLSENAAVLNYFLIAAVLFLLVLVAGVLMISGSMNSSVAQRTKSFGTMRCLGMSRRQVVRYVRLEALYLCKTAIPIGVALGILLSWILCAVLRFLVGEEFTTIPLFGVSLIGILSGVLMGVITILLAAASPAKRASKVAPVTAASGVLAQSGATDGMSSACSRNIVTVLGFHHAVSARKNLFLMIGSFALSILLFLSFQVVTELVDYMLPQSAANSDFTIASSDGSNTIDSALIGRLSPMDGVRRVFGQRCLLDFSAEINRQAEPIDLISYGDFELTCLKENGLLERSRDLQNVLGNGGQVLAVGNGKLPIASGDVVQINGKETTIAGLLRYNPFTSDGSPDERVTLIASDETFLALTGVSDYAVVLLQTVRDIPEEAVAALCQASEGNGEWKDVRSQSTGNTRTCFMLLVYAFVAIIALVTLLSIMNNISMSVSAKTKQYGVMRATGMSEKQLKRMIAAEAATYAGLGLLVGCLAGLPLSRWLYGYLITAHYSFAVWRVPVVSILMICLFAFLSVLAAIHAPIKCMQHISLTETIGGYAE